MKVKTKKKKLKPKIDEIDNNINAKDSHDINTIKKKFLKTFEKNEESLFENNKNLDFQYFLKKIKISAHLKLKKKYDCTPSKYDSYILDYLLNNLDCHIVSIFKEKMITDFIEEFLRRKYNYVECSQRIPKFSLYYKNYLHFFCKPVYNNFKFNKIIQNYGEKKAELYYKQNYQGGVTNEEGDNGMEKSSDDESSNKENEYEFKEDGNIFNEQIKEKLDNVTVMTTISTVGNNTINLNINNEKIEVFSENKADVSNDTTVGEIMNDIKKEIIKLQNKKTKSIKKKYKYSYKSIMNFSLKHQDKSKDNKYHKNLSIENRKRLKSKNISKKLLLNNEKKDNISKRKFRSNNEKVKSQKIKSKIIKYNIESYKINTNRLKKISREKIEKILKNRYTKNSFNSLYNINYPYYNFSKDSMSNVRNISSNIKSTENRKSKRENFSGYSEKKIKFRSRNQLNSLYKSGIGGMNTTTGQNSNLNLLTTRRNKINLTNLVKSGTKTFKTMKLVKKSLHQKTNSQLIPNQQFKKNKSKISSNNKKMIIPENKISSMKSLDTDFETQHKFKSNNDIPKKDKFKKNKNINININNNLRKINNKNKSLNTNDNNNFNHKITVTTNNYLNNLKNKTSKVNNLNKKRIFDNSKEIFSTNNQKHSCMINNVNPHQLLYNNEECLTFRKNLDYNYNSTTKNNNNNIMQIALSLLIDNNSPTKKNIITNSIFNNTSLNNDTNILMRPNIINQKDSQNNYFNINSPTHYNININNQINININDKINEKFNNIKKQKINKNKLKKNININKLERERKNNIPKKSIHQNINSINNKLANLHTERNNKIENRIKTRNYNEHLKCGKTQNINSSRNEREIKGYHTKSMSDLEKLINHNRKLIALYKTMSKIEEK